MSILADPTVAVPSSPAHALPPAARQQLALDALACRQPVTDLAQQHQVSRKFVYQQVATARDALRDAFGPPDPGADHALFYLPVTEAWLQQLVLGLLLVCHSSYRGVLELLRDLFDYPVALGTIHAIVRAALPRARAVNDAEDLSAVRIGAHDEIFQHEQPVLVGADVDSTYCYLLSLEEHRDAETWGVRLLELQDRGLRPQATVADAGAGLRAGQQLAWPDVPCRGDVFHILREVQALAVALENQAYQAIAARTTLERQQTEYQRRHGRYSCSLGQQGRQARAREAHAIALADDVAVLLRWLREDILSVAGPSYADRCALYDFVVAELRAREKGGPKRVAEVRRPLQQQRDDLLAFAARLEEDLAALAAQFGVPVAVVGELLQVQALGEHQPQRWRREAALRERLRGGFYPLSRAVAQVARGVVRASSVIENLNSRLRCYFFLRRQLGGDYLTLLRFFLNHRRFLRSERRERVGRSPAELLSGQRHAHWLELLGYTLFRRS